MKTANIKFSAFAYDANNNIIGHRFFCSESAANNWANKWYRVDEDATVILYDFVSGAEYCTYHA